MQSVCLLLKVADTRPIPLTKHVFSRNEQYSTLVRQVDGPKIAQASNGSAAVVKCQFRQAHTELAADDGS